MPERANLRYYLIAMDWFKRWEAYTSSQDQNVEPPGPINHKNDIKTLIITKDLFELVGRDYFYKSIHLKDNCKEDLHYKVVDE